MDLHNQQANEQIFALTKTIPSVGAGGKARGLASLIGSGLNVPSGFIIINGWKPSLEGAIAEAYRSLGEGAVAVRSSSTGEDGHALSAAGQYESFLNVRGLDELVAAVKRCFISAGANRVKHYHKNMGNLSPVGMAVIVQKMVEAAKAGVLFTADPASGNRNALVLEAVEGLGEDLVGGKERAEHYVINRADLDRKAPTHQGQRILDGREIKSLAEEALIAERSFGYPLDLEWAIDGDGTLFWLQARPITTLESATSLDTPISRNELVTRCNIGEMLPGAATPLTLSVFAEPLDRGLVEMTRKTGALRKVDFTPRFINHVENHLFMNLTSMFYIARNVAGASREAVELNILGKVLPPYDIGPNAPRLSRLANGLRYGFILFSHNRYLRQIRRMGRRFRLPEDREDMHVLYGNLCGLQQSVLNRAYFLHYCVSAHSGAMNGALAAALAGGRNVSTEAHAKMGMLLTDIEGIESADVVAGFERLAESIREQQETDRFISLQPAEAVEWISGPHSGAAGNLYQAFLKRHGHRCIREADLRSKDYESYPEEVVRTVQDLLTAGPRDQAGGENKHTGEKHSLAVAWLLKQAKEGVRQRELSKSMLILIQHQFKLGYRRLAEMMEAAELIPDADLIYFFTREEIGTLIEGGESTRLIRLGERRRNELPEQMKLVFPETSWGVPEPLQVLNDQERRSPILSGTPVSRGIVKGPVRIVTSLEEAHELEEGEIMVAPFTDIGWTPFFSRIAGLVTEIGGALSHGAVVAREYGLPMVSNVPAATSTLRTGLPVKLNGTSGTVAVLDDDI